MPPLPSAFKTFWHPWLAFAYERTQKSKAKRRKLKKFISINLQWLSFFSVLSSLFQFLFFSPSLSPSAFCSRSSALCNITIGWNHFWGIFSFFLPSFFFKFGTNYRMESKYVVWLTFDHLDLGTIPKWNMFSIIMKSQQVVHN